VISGGQTGVDQAALRTAQADNLEIGGWCPPGRICESGEIPESFPLKETPHDRSPRAPDVPRSLRTEWNVRDSDGTLILQPQTGALPDAGTEWTKRCAEIYRKPLLICDPRDPTLVQTGIEWLGKNQIRTLNVAGPSEKTHPGIGELTSRFLSAVFAAKPRDTRDA
jgi:hypothetical protein